MELFHHLLRFSMIFSLWVKFGASSQFVWAKNAISQLRSLLPNPTQGDFDELTLSWLKYSIYLEYMSISLDVPLESSTLMG